MSRVQQEKAALLADLKENGDIYPDDGASALAIWRKRCGITWDKQQDFNNRVIFFRTSGVVEADRSHVRLLNADAAPSAPIDRAVESAKASTPRRTRLDRIMDEVKRLPVEERLMVAGEIIDQAAEDVTAHFAKLREVLG